MKLILSGISSLCITALVPVAAMAESNDRPPYSEPLLEIVTYDDGYGTVHESYVLGHRVTGDIRFVTIGERDTRREGFDRKGRRH
jgi:hypothetical protein